MLGYLVHRSDHNFTLELELALLAVMIWGLHSRRFPVAERSSLTAAAIADGHLALAGQSNVALLDPEPGVILKRTGTRMLQVSPNAAAPSGKQAICHD